MDPRDHKVPAVPEWAVPVATERTTMPTDTEVVQAAADAAEGVIFSRYKQSKVEDVDVTVTFEDGVLDVDIYVNPPPEHEADPERVIDDAATAAEAAVDELFADEK